MSQPPAAPQTPLDADTTGSGTPVGQIEAARTGVVLFALAMTFLWASSLIPGFTEWQRAVLGAPFLTTGLAFVVLPLAYAGWVGLSRAGMEPVQPKPALVSGLRSLVVLGPLTGITFPFVAGRGWTPYDLAGGATLAGAMAAGFFLVALVLRGATRLTDDGAATGRVHRILWWGASLIALAALLQPYAPGFTPVLHALFFVGFGEEFLFRGLIQGSLNRAFPRSWALLGTRFGLGLFGAALLFGLAHLLSPSGPFQPGWALWTCVGGAVFGLIRERGGSYVASGVAHGVTVAIPALMTWLG